MGKPTTGPSYLPEGPTPYTPPSTAQQTSYESELVSFWFLGVEYWIPRSVFNEINALDPVDMTIENIRPFLIPYGAPKALPSETPQGAPTEDQVSFWFLGEEYFIPRSVFNEINSLNPIDMTVENIRPFLIPYGAPEAPDQITQQAIETTSDTIDPYAGQTQEELEEYGVGQIYGLVAMKKLLTYTYPDGTSTSWVDLIYVPTNLVQEQLNAGYVLA